MSYAVPPSCGACMYLERPNWWTNLCEGLSESSKLDRDFCWYRFSLPLGPNRRRGVPTIACFGKQCMISLGDDASSFLGHLLKSKRNNQKF